MTKDAPTATGVSPLAPVDLTGADPAGQAVASSPLDHGGDGRDGGAAPEPEVSHYVALKDDAERGFAHGEVLALTSGQVRGLIKAEVVRPATAEEVELAQPFVRRLTA